MIEQHIEVSIARESEDWSGRLMREVDLTDGALERLQALVTRLEDQLHPVLVKRDDSPEVAEGYLLPDECPLIIEQQVRQRGVVESLQARLERLSSRLAT